MFERLRSFARRYVRNEDVEERNEEVNRQLAVGKSREAVALKRVAEATGDEELRRDAEAAEREAMRIRRMMKADDVAIEVFTGQREED